MDLDNMLAELREARDQVEEAILALERLARGTRHAGGRRPEWLSAIVGEQSTGEPRRARSKRSRPRTARKDSVGQSGG